jgi:hypothetical protein
MRRLSDRPDDALEAVATFVHGPPEPGQRPSQVAKPGVVVLLGGLVGIGLAAWGCL